MMIIWGLRYVKLDIIVMQWIDYRSIIFATWNNRRLVQNWISNSRYVNNPLQRPNQIDKVNVRASVSCLIRDIYHYNCRASVGPGEFISGRITKRVTSRRKFLRRSDALDDDQSVNYHSDRNCRDGTGSEIWSWINFYVSPGNQRNNGSISRCRDMRYLPPEMARMCCTGGNSPRIQLRKVLFSHYHFADGCAHIHIHIRKIHTAHV